MKALLMHPDRDFEPQSDSSPQERDLTQDLALETLLRAMAGGDSFLFDVAHAALVSGLQNDRDTIVYRQEIVQDCIRNAAVVRELHALAAEGIDKKKSSYFGFPSRYPGGILYGSIDSLRIFIGILAKLKRIADVNAGLFKSRGFTRFFAMLQSELGDEYLATVQNHLAELKFKGGVLMSAELGKGNEGTNSMLRQAGDKMPNWLDRILGKGPAGYTFRIHDRDEAGARALSELRDRGINLVANAAAQSTDYIASFFEMLSRELAFYIGCLNLHDRLASARVPMSFPRAEIAGTRTLRFSGLCDVSLALSTGQSVVGNSIDADGKTLVIITGANQGGKSSFLRGVGLAQLMMQCGMFVGAESFAGELCAGIFTHYKREEDATMEKGKLDEELSRISDIVDVVAPNAMLLLNESFAATNEREGSEIARQIVSALREKGVRIFFVTHLYDFAHDLFTRETADALFLRAERLTDGTRTFRIVPGAPLETSYGEDVYRTVFAVEGGKMV